MPENTENQIQKPAVRTQEELMFFPRISLKIFFWEIFLFSLTLGLGIAAAFSLGGVKSEEQIPLPEISIWDFILGFALATLFILFFSRLSKFQKGKRVLYGFLFLIVAWWAGAALISVWILGSVALVLMAGLVFWRWKSPNIFNHNLCMVLGLAGIGSGLGVALDPWTVVVLLIIFSIYDFIAVYKTKHMQKMAEEMAGYGAIFALVIPQRFSEFRQPLKRAKPGGRFLILGGGDIAFPLLLCSSLTATGILGSLIVAVFSVLGLGVSFWIFFSQKTRKPIPALPPIAFFSIVGFLLTLIIR